MTVYSFGSLDKLAAKLLHYRASVVPIGGVAGGTEFVERFMDLHEISQVLALL